MARYVGVLDGWFETGSEGVCWILDTGKKDPIFIEPGDHLKVFAKDGALLFGGEIVPDYSTGWRRFPKNKEYGQQSALGYWIHWIQRGWKPDEWASLFLKHKDWAHTHAQAREWKKCKKLRAELIKKRKKRL